MNIKSFLKLVEIQTMTSSIIPFLLESFKELQTKKDTFGLAVENFGITNVALAITIVVGVII
ncbi:MAG: hypothetical protein GX258_04845 [Clostridiales bacterium]|nr:hypothetical protein [Clostridiales bacterium]